MSTNRRNNPGRGPDPLEELGRRRAAQPPGPGPAGAVDPNGPAYAIIADVAISLASTLDLTEILNKIVDGIIKVTGCDRGFLMLRERDGGFSTFTGRYADMAEWVESDTPEISHSVRDRVADTHEVFAVSDLRQLDDFKASDSIQAGGLVAAVCLPLIYKEELIGVIYADSTHMLPRSLDASHQVLSAFATQASFAIENARSHGELSRDADRGGRGDSSPVRKFTAEGMATRNKAMRDVIATVERIAPSPLTVLMQGESGTGKEVFARAIHQLSPRSGRPFIPVNCSGMPHELVESILFGHRRGAFTGAISDRPGLFEAAEGGTLFLDEIGDMPLATQPKLLRVLENREIARVGEESVFRKVDVRIIAATNRDLPAAVASAAFRDDLFNRLNGAQIYLPPLRERREDIIPLAEYFLSRYAAEYGIPEPRLSNGARALLLADAWAGNVRSLKSAIEFGVQFRDERNVIPAEAIERHLGPARRVPAAADGGSFRELMERYEENVIRRALADNGGNVSRTADALQLSRQHLHAKIKKYGIVARDE
jgi:Nif-specific regulatory protein